MKTDSYSRKISTKETRKRFIFILKKQIKFKQISWRYDRCPESKTCRKRSRYQNLKL